MSLLRPQNPVRSYRAAIRFQKAVALPTSRCTSQTAPQRSKPGSESGFADRIQATEDQSSLVTQESPPDPFVSRQPDYSARIDQGTSAFSPVPKRVMDGSEPGEIVAAAVLSGAPVDLQARQVRIFRPAKTATQSGTWHAHQWRMDWDILQKGHRWENPLMGWQSTGDSMQGTHLNFRTKEEAIQFAQKQGYEYFLQEPNERRIVPKAYANNFVHEPKKLKHIKTK